MMHLSEKVSYLKGMAEGMQLQQQSREGRLVLELLELIDDLIVEFERAADRQDELHDYVDAIDEDLRNLESFVYDEDGFDEEEDTLDEESADDENHAYSAQPDTSAEEPVYV